MSRFVSAQSSGGAVMLRLGSVHLLFLLALFNFSTSVTAQVTVAAAQPGAVPAVEVVGAEAVLSVAVVAEEAGYTLRLSPTVRHVSDTLMVRASWQLGTEQLDPQTSISLPVGTSTLLLRAVLPEPGVYESFFEILGASNTPLRHVPLRFERKLAELPDGFLPENQSFKLMASALSVFWPWDQQRFVIAVEGQSEIDLDLTGARAVVGAIVQQEGVEERGQAVTLPAGAVTNHCTEPVVARQPCTIELHLPVLSPGTWTFDLALAMPGGAAATTHMVLQVRASAFWAGLLVVLGALAAAFVYHWRNVDRVALLEQLPFVQLREDVRLFAASAPEPVRPALARLADKLSGLLNRSWLGGAIPAGSIDEPVLDLAALRQAADALERAGQAARHGPTIVAPLVAALTDSLAHQPWTRIETETATTALHSALNAQPGLARVAKSLQNALGSLMNGVAGLSSKARQTFEAQLIAAKDDLARASDAVLTPEDIGTREKALLAHTTKLAAMLPEVIRALHVELADRASRIGAAIAKLPSTDALASRSRKELDAILARLTPAAKLDDILVLREELHALGLGVGVPETDAGGAAVPLPDAPVTSLDLDIPRRSLIPGPEAGTVANLRRLRTFDWLSNGIVALLIGAAGIVVLWMPSPAWGSLEDILAALLAGAGTRFALPAVRQPSFT